jgi:hypothetical protein
MRREVQVAALALACLVDGAAAESHTINITHAQIYDLAWHYASADQLAATNQAIVDNARDMDIAWLVICGQFRLHHTKVRRRALPKTYC